MEKPNIIADVSIICANYNNGRYLEEFVQSVANSSMLPLELLVIDDGSSDNSIELLEQMIEFTWLKVIRFEQNKGFARALNAGLDVARGKYIMRADPDDILHPKRIEKQFQYLEAHPEIDVLGCNVVYFNGKTQAVINKSSFPLTNQAIHKAYRKGEHGIQHPTAFIRSGVYKKYRYVPDVFPSEDYQLFASMAKVGHRFANLPDLLYKMRVHPASSTSNTTLKSLQQTFKFRDEIFGTKTSKLKVYSYYLFIKNYRSYQLHSGGGAAKYYYLAIAIMAYPAKIFKRIRRR
jgi:glycosyltransferase involved in cell wall biosynthesis